jgi:hypothetical protein
VLQLALFVGLAICSGVICASCASVIWPVSPVPPVVSTVLAPAARAALSEWVGGHRGLDSCDLIAGPSEGSIPAMEVVKEVRSRSFVRVGETCARRLEHGELAGGGARLLRLRERGGEGGRVGGGVRLEAEGDGELVGERLLRLVLRFRRPRGRRA